MTTGSDFWTPQKVIELERLWDEGLSCSQIGAKLGATRNAIIGKVHRMGLTQRTPLPTPPRPKADRAAKTAKTATKSRTIFPERKHEWKDIPSMDVPAPVNGGIPTANLVQGMCKAVTTVATPYVTARHCGHETYGGSNFCVGHFYKFYRPSERRQA